MRTRFWTAIVAIACLSALAHVIDAQQSAATMSTSTGSVAGVVKDPSGAVIAGAQVELRSTTTNFHQTHDLRSFRSLFLCLRSRLATIRSPSPLQDLPHRFFAHSLFPQAWNFLQTSRSRLPKRRPAFRSKDRTPVPLPPRLSRRSHPTPPKVITAPMCWPMCRVSACMAMANWPPFPSCMAWATSAPRSWWMA